MTDLGFKMTQARVVREAFEAGKISRREYALWLQELQRPTGFWSRLFGI